MKMKKVFPLFLFLLAGILSANAQSGDRKIASSTNGWYSMINELRLSPKWYLYNELHIRRADVYQEWQQLLIRPAINYLINPNLEVAVGYSYLKTHPYGDQPLRVAVPENQLWQQVLLRQSIGKAGLIHRYRLEERWIGRTVGNDSDGYRIDGSDYAQRFRYRLLLRVPLYTLEEGKKQFFAAAFDEIFINLENSLMPLNFQQNRIYLGAGYQFNSMGNIQAGYMQQVIRKADGIHYERNPTLNISLFYNFDLYKK